MCNYVLVCLILLVLLLGVRVTFSIQTPWGDGMHPPSPLVK